MSTVIRAAGPADVDAICTLLHSKMNSKFPVERWRRLMSYPWLEDKPDYGVVVESDGRILGYTGLIYSERMIGDEQRGFRKERFASMSSWYLDKSLRGRGLGKGMLLATMEDTSLTYTIFTNSSKPIGIVKALGYQVLDDRRYHWHRSGAASSALVLTRDIDGIRERATAVQRQILDDMQIMPVTPIFLEIDGREALLFLSIKSKGEDVQWYDLLYTSDADLFTDCAPLLANSLLPDTPSVLAADSRLIRTPPADTICELLPVERHFLSQSVEPRDIDFLYSELQLLDLKLD
ncbi:GNAT family N-acetyltransferase [Granulosicoccus sp. 3-233]|uniref:GNAT family N-acetyltransferase n=1 Tax=Granulosicoccus sp. 3-233 TaxID=3417969 RepID=UPI003D35954B